MDSPHFCVARPFPGTSRHRRDASAPREVNYLRGTWWNQKHPSWHPGSNSIVALGMSRVHRMFTILLWELAKARALGVSNTDSLCMLCQFLSLYILHSSKFNWTFPHVDPHPDTSVFLPRGQRTFHGVKTKLSLLSCTDWKLKKTPSPMWNVPLFIILCVFKSNYPTPKRK